MEQISCEKKASRFPDTSQTQQNKVYADAEFSRMWLPDNMYNLCVAMANVFAIATVLANKVFTLINAEVLTDTRATCHV